ncbi:MAG: hypothetical protein VX438_18480 [Planctomycetota bacterium]|nr:hypothetical protein [Planctomycetota bacterium]
MDISKIVKRPKVRSPRSNGESFVAPCSELGALVQSNHARLAGPHAAGKGVCESGIDLAALRDRARKELINAAFRFTENYSSPGDRPSPTEKWIFLSGHQPDLFHPGVWFKSFLLNQLGKAYQSLAVNLVIDNDECTETSIVVPAGSLEKPFIKKIQFDEGGPSQPFENRRWKSDAAFSGFCAKVKDSLGKVSQYGLVLDRFWELLSPARQATGLVGQSIAQARHELEIENGVRNVEVPLSHVCRGEAFKRFLASVLLQARTVQAVYNDSLQQFRSVYRVRSATHPVPMLREEEGWREMPFWIWSNEHPVRSPLYVRSSANTIELSNLREIRIGLPTERLSESLAELEFNHHPAFSIRPRALMTTLYARVFLADLFVHGIGGAKYDELTDLMIQRFYGIEPPGFLTATSTHFLPFGESSTDDRELRQVKSEIRERQFHPEQFVEQVAMECPGDLAALIDEKRQLLREIPPLGEKRGWHQRISLVNQKLLEANLNGLQRAKLRSTNLEEEKRRREILCSRDYSFILHSPRLLEDLKQISAKAVNNRI